MKTLQLSLDKAKEAYNNGSAEIRQFLETSYGKENFIKTGLDYYKDACFALAITPLTKEDFNLLPEDQREVIYITHVLTTVIKHRRNGWKPDFKNTDQRKYYVYLSIGFGLSFGFACYHCFDSGDLYVENSDEAQFMIDNFSDMYTTLLTHSA